MSKAFKKERLGTVHGSLVSPEIYPSAHSPEEEKQFQKLVKELQPIMMQAIQQSINIYLEEQYEIIEGDTFQTFIQYFTNYFNTYYQGAIYTAGAGIKITSNVVSVKAGNGLVTEALADGGSLYVNLEADDPGLIIADDQLDIKKGDGITTNGDGTRLDLSGSIGSTGDGGGLDFSSEDGDGQLRVCPEDFLKMEEEE